MSYLSRKDIEAIAVQVFNDYKNLPRHAGLPIARVEPMILATELCGLHIDHFHLSKDGLTLGMTSFNEFGVKVYDDNGQPCLYYLDGVTILIEKDLKDTPSLYGRYNFTLLHETAHQILSRLFPNSQKAVQNRIVCYRGQGLQYPIQDWSEWQADNLASALLLPVEIVLGALYRFDLENGIEILNKVPKAVAEMLAERKREIDELKRLLGDEYRDYNLVFASTQGTPTEANVVNRAFSKLIKENELPKVVFHSLRHTSTTYKLKLSGGDIKAVQGDTGHAQATMVTERYAHILDDDRRVNAVRFQKEFYGGGNVVEPEVPLATSSAVSIQQAPIGDPLQNLDAATKQQLLLKLFAESPEMSALLTALAGRSA